MSNLDHPSVMRVRAWLADASSPAEVIELNETARSAQDAADSIYTELGSIVKSLVFAVAGKPVRLRFVMKDADLYSIRFKN